ncbi:UDP-N-acetylmuramoyl-L-alanine--D-glutamate ligase [Treponema parvum]|uniref:UDP-N-acetylmuramoylalanine--D-glutamate ligase n=1 Tax=Treponema parvum TaxID=138851 RepID=A0A975F589_9SPIR|nr:UDP-N-acetylmuramoyl-L-alanine--D-glutamate ligase [Treponema parvum]QTQ14711.1 UDP-N-acetylmuramoyl-L-alanine--D-glutamate ligase [Treponema parvum]
MSENFFSYPKGCVFKTLKNIKGKHITVMGLGLNGGGEASVRFFLQKGAFVTVTDMKTEDELKPSVERLEKDPSIDKSHLTYRLGEHRIEDFSSADCVIKNPGVKIVGNKFLAAARAIETDISIFLYFSKAPVIAVTGSKGKSSTASAIHYGLCRAGFNAFLGGNITVSPLTFLDETSEKTPVVLELSSWQLADLRGRGTLKPEIAIITKIVPDHQNWYGSMESYVADKRLIYENQTSEDFTVIDAGADEPEAAPKTGGTWGDLFASETKGTVLRYGKAPLPKGVLGVWQEGYGKNFSGKSRLPLNGSVSEEIILKELSVPGPHMKANVLNAALVLRLFGISSERTAQILKDWPGIPHRLQFFYEWKRNASGAGGRKDEGQKFTYRFYNDSCATVPEAAAAATQSFDRPIILIAGGTDKDLDFSALSKVLSQKKKTAVPVRALYLLSGSGTDKLIKRLYPDGTKYKGPFDSLSDLLKTLKADLEDPCARHDSDEKYGFIPIVFSPGATSFGMFVNEFDRGEKFMTEVKKIFT